MSKSHLSKRERIANNLPYRHKVPVAVREKFAKDFMNHHNVLVSYLRDEHRNPYGVVVAFKEGDVIRTGIALCNTKVDNWNKYVGLDLAIQRALAGIQLESYPPGDYVFRAITKMETRAEKYFKPTIWDDNIDAIFGGHRLGKICRDI
jgi:hypothetical protein